MTLPDDESALPKAAKSVCADQNGAVWIGLLSGGLERWQNDLLTNVAVNADGANVGPVFCAYPDRQNRLWVSAGDEDLFVRETAGKFRRITPVVHGVKAILADHAGRIWAGTTSGLFLSEASSPDKFLACSKASRGVPSARWRRIHAAAFGLALPAASCIRIASNTAAVFHPTDSRESGSVWSVLADRDGTIWAGTFRGGLLRFRDGQFTCFGKKNGLPDDVICQILDDGRGNLWLGSHQGVFRVAKASLNEAARDENRIISCVAYGRSDGMPSLECSGGYQPAGWRDSAGRLWFATAKGATWVQPDEVRPNLKPPLVAIEEILVDGRAQNLLQTDSGALEIPPGRHQLEFRYTGLSFASPEGVQFRFRLDGLDEDWVQAGTRRFAQYNFLPPGNYRFHVIACNSDEVWNETGREVAVIIRPHFYEIWWFRVLAVLAVLGTVALVVRQFATRRLHRQMEQLERRQSHRARTRPHRQGHS